MNQTLQEMLRIYARDNTEDWNEYLEVVIFEYNCSIHPGTNETPFYLNRGREPRTPLQFALELDLGEGIKKKKDRDVAFGRLVRRLKAAMERVATRKGKRQETRERKERVVTNKFKIGEKVWLRTWTATNLTKGITAKMASKAEGPYEIVGVPTEQTIVIKLDDGTEKRVNVANTRKHVEREVWMEDSDESEEEVVDFGNEDNADIDFNDEEYTP